MIPVAGRPPLALAAGPLALAGFFQPWFEGRGLLAGEQYSGYNVLQFSAWLQAADPGATELVALWAARLLTVGVVVAGLWLTVLAPAMRDHWLYRLSGCYLVVAAVVLLGAGAAWQGVACRSST